MGHFLTCKLELFSGNEQTTSNLGSTVLSASSNYQLDINSSCLYLNEAAHNLLILTTKKNRRKEQNEKYNNNIIIIHPNQGKEKEA
jgi:hypothetical protein